MEKRKYTKRQRAASQQQTRDRIVDAAMCLHEEIGPRNTTISAIAERAGVQRLTVYRHFEDDQAIFQACSSRWLELNPPPDPGQWQDMGSPAERTCTALQLYYAYYGNTAAMWQGVYRDEAEVPAMRAVMDDFRSYQAGVRDQLVKAWQPTGASRRKLRALTSHALEFSTWQSLHDAKMKDNEIAELFVHCIESLLEP